jgi:hypothetical protein
MTWRSRWNESTVRYCSLPVAMTDFGPPHRCRHAPWTDCVGTTTRRPTSTCLTRAPAIGYPPITCLLEACAAAWRKRLAVHRKQPREYSRNGGRSCSDSWRRLLLEAPHGSRSVANLAFGITLTCRETACSCARLRSEPRPSAPFRTMAIQRPMVGGVCAEARRRPTSNTSTVAPTTSIMPDGAARERSVSLWPPKKNS